MITFKPFFLIAAISVISACSTAKLEARLEANPQCKDVVNPKTGALMPCPGSDKAFYASVGLAPAKTNAAATNASSTPTSASTQSPSGVASSSNQAEARVSSSSSSSAAPVSTITPECKPQIHKKTGGTLPCPAAD